MDVFFKVIHKFMSRYMHPQSNPISDAGKLKDVCVAWLVVAMSVRHVLTSVHVWFRCHGSYLSRLTVMRRTRNARQRLLRQTGIGLLRPPLGVAAAMAIGLEFLAAYRSRNDSA